MTTMVSLTPQLCSAMTSNRWSKWTCSSSLPCTACSPGRDCSRTETKRVFYVRIWVAFNGLLISHQCDNLIVVFVVLYYCSFFIGSTFCCIIQIMAAEIVLHWSRLTYLVFQILQQSFVSLQRSLREMLSAQWVKRNLPLLSSDICLTSLPAYWTWGQPGWWCRSWQPSLPSLTMKTSMKAFVSKLDLL